MEYIKANVKNVERMFLNVEAFLVKKTKNTAKVFPFYSEHHRKARNRDLDFRSATQLLSVLAQLFIIRKRPLGLHQTNGI